MGKGGREGGLGMSGRERTGTRGGEGGGEGKDMPSACIPRQPTLLALASYLHVAVQTTHTFFLHPSSTSVTWPWMPAKAAVPRRAAAK